MQIKGEKEREKKARDERRDERGGRGASLCYNLP